MEKYSRFDVVLISTAIMIIAMVIGMMFSLKLVAVTGLLSLGILAYGMFIAPPITPVDRKI